MENYITLEDLKDFDVWKSWRNGGLELEPLYSEEDLKQAFKDGSKMSWTDINQETQEPYYYDFKEWFEQFKKK